MVSGNAIAAPDDEIAKIFSGDKFLLAQISVHEGNGFAVRNAETPAEFPISDFRFPILAAGSRVDRLGIVFCMWRGDDVPAYQLACVVDDAAMQITEVVRGADLLVSTARQILLYRALDLPAPDFFHCGLMLDSAGVRLAKRHDALSLRKLREQGETPESLRHKW